MVSGGQGGGGARGRRVGPAAARVGFVVLVGVGVVVMVVVRVEHVCAGRSRGAGGKEVGRGRQMRRGDGSGRVLGKGRASGGVLGLGSRDEELLLLLPVQAKLRLLLLLWREEATVHASRIDQHGWPAAALVHNQVPAAVVPSREVVHDYGGICTWRHRSRRGGAHSHRRHPARGHRGTPGGGGGHRANKVVEAVHALGTECTCLENHFLVPASGE